MNANVAAAASSELPRAPAAATQASVAAIIDDNDDDGVPNGQLLNYTFPALDVALCSVPAPLFGGRALMMMVSHAEVRSRACGARRVLPRRHVCFLLPACLSAE